MQVAGREGEAVSSPRRAVSEPKQVLRGWEGMDQGKEWREKHKEPHCEIKERKRGTGKRTTQAGMARQLRRIIRIPSSGHARWRSANLGRAARRSQSRMREMNRLIGTATTLFERAV